LVESLILEGARLLRELDRRGFVVESMLWVDLPEQDYWRLIIATLVVEQHGSGAAYLQIDETLRDLKIDTITLMDVSLRSRLAASGVFPDPGRQGEPAGGWTFLGRLRRGCGVPRVRRFHERRTELRRFFGGIGTAVGDREESFESTPAADQPERPASDNLDTPEAP
jgi:hypothetical protein